MPKHIIRSSTINAGLLFPLFKKFQRRYGIQFKRKYREENKFDLHVLLHAIYRELQDDIDSIIGSFHEGGTKEELSDYLHLLFFDDEKKVWQIDFFRDKIKNLCKEKAKEGRCIFIIGAGISFEAEIKKFTISYMVSKSLPEREKVEDEDGNILQDCWEELSNDSEKKDRFKSHFKEVIQRTNPVYAHALAAELFQMDNSKVLAIICFNWDDLINRLVDKGKQNLVVGNKIFGDVNQGKLTIDDIDRLIWYPHGNISCESVEWVLPAGPSILMNDNFSLIRKKLKSNNFFPYCVFTFGYSGEDSAISDDFIKHILEGREIYHVNPNPPPCLENDPNILNLKASTALEILKSYL